MAERNTRGRLDALYSDLKTGTIPRRDFIARATALGVGLPMILSLLQAAAAAATPGLVQESATRPSEGTEDQTRGAGGELKLLQWLAPTTLSPHAATGTKDFLAASLVLEPLMNYLPDATLIPNLVREVPSLENGLLAADLTAVTYHLLDGIVWSDGTPFTAKDVVYTWQWIMDEANASTSIEIYRPIAAVEAGDDLTVTVTFAEPQFAWYNPFVSTYNGVIYPEHVLSSGPEAHRDFLLSPIGTGPYLVESFTPNDQVVYAINENYREPNKPSFSRVTLKGGGDAASAARAVLQTGDWDLAPNLQVEPEILAQLAEGGQGTLVVIPGSNLERVAFNFSNPNETVDGQRSQWQTPHPFLTDKAVRQALSLAADRATMSDQFYAGPPGEPPSANVLVGIPAYESPHTSWEFDIAKAKQVLDDAGWTLDGGVRKKDGIELAVTFVTSINAVRQKVQAVIKEAWEELGVKVELQQVDGGIFFDSAAGNEQNFLHFYDDVQLYSNAPGGPYPISYMASWYSNDGENIAQKGNDWSGLNESRYHNPAYDALFAAAQATVDPERLAELLIQMNDLVVDDFVVIPLVQRSAEKYAIATTLRAANVAGSSWESLYWNIANWNRV